MLALLSIPLLILGQSPAGPEVELPESLKTSTTASGGLHKRSRPAMGTYVEITVFGVQEEIAQPVIEQAFEEFRRLEATMSEWQPKSALGQVNAAAGRAPVAVERELFDLVQLSLDFARRSGGAFDPTFAALWGLWTFGDDGIHRVPARDAVEARRKLIDWRRVRLEPKGRRIFLPAEGMKLGLGGIAKGYAVDRAAAILRHGGLKNFLIKAGGELYAAGLLDGKRWKVGVRDPRGPGSFGVIELTDEAFDTSGDYERFFEADGVRYHHIIDPKTGEPARASRSATILAKDCTTADALSTAVFVLGPEKGLALARSYPGVEAVVVDAENRVRLTEGLKARLQWSPPTP